MQIKNETRVLTNYPAYKISTNGSVYKIADLTTDSEVNTMKKPDSRGLAQIGLYKDGKSYKETVQDLLLSVFTHEEIQGDDKTVSDTNETDDMTESDTEFFPAKEQDDYNNLRDYRHSDVYKYSGLITKDEFEKGFGVYLFNLENTIFEL